MQVPEAALQQLAEQLRHQDTVISSHVVEPSERPVLGPLTAAGPRAAAAPAEYSLVVESIREGYELHYGTPRILAGHDDDLALLAGDYLYALGLERLAALGDDEAVAELSDLISLCAVSHAEGSAGTVPALWLGADAYARLGELTDRLAAGLRETAGDLPLQLDGAPGLLTLFFSAEPVVDFATASACDTPAYGRFCRAMLERGVYPPPSQFEAWFVSLAHDEETIDRTIEAADEALRAAG